ncbi:ejaculatory bulb-specific protein 3-like [Nymphalis io]|uniref:ejaculatory bulb-specific protein 3-like n=1 Tax=Inachis io TaxID=171585 RepID=UPI0021696D20|nr:ejaculatory bulb-specific protein 3-like [Nymphalis io]
MKVILCLFALMAITLARPEEKYTDRYDNIDLDEILNNPRVLENYFKCIMDQGKCTPDGKELKSHMQEALKDECAKCTEAQKRGTDKVMGHLINHKKDYWDQLTAKYDPDHKLREKYETKLKTLTKV